MYSAVRGQRESMSLKGYILSPMKGKTMRNDRASVRNNPTTAMTIASESRSKCPLRGVCR